MLKKTFLSIILISSVAFASEDSLFDKISNFFSNLFESEETIISDSDLKEIESTSEKEDILNIKDKISKI